VLSAS